MSKEMKPIRAGIVGLGRIGWGSHAQQILKHNGFQLVAVCDLDEGRIREAQAAAPGCAGYTKYADMLKNPELDLVVVASQTKDHVRRSAQALQARKHVLVEKPTAKTPQAIDRLAALAKKKGIVFTIHHNYRLDKELLFIKEIVAQGILGKVFRIRRYQVSFSRRNDWQTLRKNGGGAIGNWGVHVVDMSLQLVKSPVEQVWGTAGQIINPGDAEDDVKGLIRLKDGTVIDVEVSSACAYAGAKWVILGSCGTLWIEGDKAHIKWFDPKAVKALNVVDLPMVPSRQYGVVGGGDSIPWQEKVVDVAPTGTYESFYDNLYQAIRNGKKLLVDPASARVTYDVLARIRKNSGY